MLHVFDLSGNLPVALAVGSTLFGPTGGDIDGVGSHCVEAKKRRCTMQDRSSFNEARSKLIPLIGLNGDVMFEEKAWFSGRAAFAAVKTSYRFKNAINSGCRNF